MSFFWGGKKKEDTKAFYDNFLVEKRYSTQFINCVETCIEDYSYGLDNEEKVCLAKCLDRTNDYLELAREDFVGFLKNK